MDAELQEQQAAATPVHHSGGFFGNLLSSPFLWGGLATVIFYQLIPFLPVHRELVERYFCGHPLEYVLAGLFFLGFGILLLKIVGVTAEKSALVSGQSLLDELLLHNPPADAEESVSRIESRLNTAPRAVQQSALMTRVSDACGHVKGRRSTKGLDGHLKYLAELTSERLYESFALIRTITWAIPIIGFLGTVIGITLAISNLTPEQLDKSLNAVTNGLGVAFDTTALALVLSVLLVFTSFLVERSEQRVLSRIEDAGIKRIAMLFPTSTEAQTPLLEAEAAAARSMIEKTDLLIEKQTELWQSALESTRDKWMAALDGQKLEFDAALQSGMQATLSDHAEQLQTIRQEFLLDFREATTELQSGLLESQRFQREMQAGFQTQTDDLWNRIREGIEKLQTDQHTDFSQLTESVSYQIAAWQTQLRESTEAGVEQLVELRRQREVLLKVAEQEENLTRLQERLTQNLGSLRATENFEETMHSLSAAVHLLSARTRPNAA